jgi:hypothetical protein
MYRTQGLATPNPSVASLSPKDKHGCPVPGELRNALLVVDPCSFAILTIHPGAYVRTDSTVLSSTLDSGWIRHCCFIAGTSTALRTSVHATLLKSPVHNSSYSDGMLDFLTCNPFLRTLFHQTSITRAHIRADPVDGVIQLTMIRSLPTPLRRTYSTLKQSADAVDPFGDDTPLLQWRQARWKMAWKCIVVTCITVTNHWESTRIAHSRCESPPIGKYDGKQANISAK